MPRRLADRRELMNERGIARALKRMAHEIVERCGGAQTLALVGVRTGGAFLAERLRAFVLDAEKVEVPLGILDITLYRDDVFESLSKPVVGPTQIPFDLRDRAVVLVDDVLYTGRTVRAALDALIEFGRPRAVTLAVLIDRGWRELPIQADFVGLRVTTSKDETVDVMLREKGETDCVMLREKSH